MLPGDTKPPTELRGLGISSSSSPVAKTTKEKSRASLEGLVTKHKLHTKEARATKSLGKLGVRLKKVKKEEDGGDESLNSSKDEIDDVKEDSIKDEMASPAPSSSGPNLLGLGDYGSSSGDSD